MYTDELIQELINCPKVVIETIKEMKEGRSGFLKKSFSFASKDGNHSFNGFIVQNLKFTENFSIGLTYAPKEEKGNIVLLRCNGPHGPHRTIPHHAYFHIHRATAERINNGQKPEGHIEITTEYSTLDDAIQFYIKLINIAMEDRIKHFPAPSGQLDLFNNEEFF